MKRVLLLAALLAAGACGDRAESRPSDPAAVQRVARFACPEDAGAGGAQVALGGRKLRIVTTVSPITSIVANVAGDLAEVRGLVPEGESAHTFEPRPSDAATLAGADVVFVNGLQLEDPTRALAGRRRRDGSRIVELGTLALRPDQYLYDRSFPKAGGAPNPHLWTNPPMARCYVVIVGRVLAAADPANAGAYRANAEAYAAKIDALDHAMRRATATVPPERRRLLTYHDAYAYMAAHYRWTVVGAAQPSSFDDPSPRDVARLIDQVRAERIPAVFGSEVFPSPVLAQIAREAGATYVAALRDDDLPGRPGDEEHSYLGLMRFDFVTLVVHLGGDATALERVDVADVGPDRATYPQ